MNLKHVFGNVNANGTVQSGSSTLVTVAHDDKGEYTIVFDKGLFSQIPAVTVTQNYPGWNDFRSNGGSTKDNATIIAISKEKVKIKTGDGGGAATDRNFSFIAVGA